MIKKLECFECGKQHIEVDYNKLTKAQLSGQAPIMTNFICENIARRYRVLSFALDLRLNSVNSKFEAASAPAIASLQTQWGVYDFDKKLNRFKQLDVAFMGLPEEYYNFLMQIVDTYCCGYFYPAQTSAGALGERILNRLIIKTRGYFKSTAEYKKVYSKDSFDNWDLPVKTLQNWNVISEDVAKLFNELKEFRNDAI